MEAHRLVMLGHASEVIIEWRRTVKNFCSALALILIATGSAKAQVENHNTANYLADVCKNWDTSANYSAGFCLGFIKGVDSELDVCEGSEVTLGQLVKVTIKYMDDHPEELDQPASTVVHRALTKAFPCKK
jgi:Rap1a immunity proteins